MRSLRACRGGAPVAARRHQRAPTSTKDIAPLSEDSNRASQSYSERSVPHTWRVALLLSSIAVGACSNSRSTTAPTPLSGGNDTTPPGPATSIVIRPASDSLAPGQTLQYTDTVRDSAGRVLANQTVLWGSSNSKIAAISITGLVTALAVGHDTIEALVGKALGQVVLTVGPGTLDHIAVSPNPATIANGGTVALQATAFNARSDTLKGYIISWALKNPAVATVTGGGLVTGESPGTDTVTATSGGIAGTAIVLVQTAPVASVVVVPAADTLQIGSTVQLTDTAKDANSHVLRGQVVTWASSTPSVATVNATGRLTALAAGTTVVTATANGVSGRATIVVAQNNQPANEVFAFDKDTLVPFGVPYDISAHVRWIIKNATGDSVGATSLASVSAVTYYPVLGNGAPGACQVLAGTFVAYCPDGGWPTGASSFQTNGYWSVTVRAKPVSGIKDQHNTIWWYVNGNLPGSQPLYFSAPPKPPAYPVTYKDTVNLAILDTIRVQTAQGLPVSIVPMSVAVAAVFDTGQYPNPVQGPGDPAPCDTAAGLLRVHCVPSGNQYLESIGYAALVTVKPTSFNGISNPAFVAGIELDVAPLPFPSVTVIPGAATIAVGDSVRVTEVTTDPATGEVLPGDAGWLPYPTGIVSFTSPATAAPSLYGVGDTVTVYGLAPGTTSIAVWTSPFGEVNQGEGTFSVTVLPGPSGRVVRGAVIYPFDRRRRAMGSPMNSAQPLRPARGALSR